MNTRVGLMVLMLTGVFFGQGTAKAAAPGTSSAYIIAGYKTGNPDPTVAPEGKFTIDRALVAGDEFQVIVDAVVDKGPGIGFEVWAGMRKYTQDVATAGGTTIPFGPPAPITIKNPPDDLQIRGKIMWRPDKNTAWKEIKVVFTPFKSAVSQ